MRIAISALLLLLGVGVGAVVLAQSDKQKAGTDAFGTVYKVLQHPRCMNCHPQGDAPLQYDDSRPHGQNITRLSEKNGLPCGACHREKNGTKPNTPPGAPHWHLPPKDVPMIFEGKSPRQLCEQLKDPKQTGGRSLQQLIEHVDKDALVLWGWSPGPGRKPVSVPHEQFVDAMKIWSSTGAPCPE